MSGMNHDYAHCWDYEKGVCPEGCFRAELTEDLKNWPYPVAYIKFRKTKVCPLTNPPPKPSNGDRLRSLPDEELAKAIARKITWCYGCPATNELSAGREGGDKG